MLAKKHIYPILIFLCFLVYANSLNNAFVCDDIPAIIENPFIAHPWRVWTDLLSFLNSLNYLISGYRPFSYHLTNILMHALVTILVFLFLKLFFKAEASFLAACLFVVHPIHTEAVTWISGGNYIVKALFILGIYLLYHKATDFAQQTKKLSPKIYLTCLILFSYFALSNFVYCTMLLFFLILSDVTFKRWRRNWKLLFPFMIIIAIRLILAKVEIAERISFTAKELTGGVVTWNNPILNMAYSLSSHIWLLIWPVKLTFFHEPEVFSSLHLIFGLVILSLMAVSLPLLFKKSKVIFFALGIFILFLAPTYSPLKVCLLVTERYLYFPSLTLCFFMAFFYEMYISKAEKDNSRRRKALILFFLLLTAYGVRTIVRNEDWKTPGRFWRATASASPYYPQARNAMGVTYLQEGNINAAISESQRAIELKPDYAKAYNGRGNAYQAQGNFLQAISDYNKALQLNPSYADVYYNRGLTYRKQGNFNQALLDYNQAIKLNPDYADVYNNRGNIYREQGNFKQAISDYNQAIKLNPNHALAFKNRAVVYLLKKEYDKAREDVHKAEALGFKVNSEILKELDKEGEKVKGVEGQAGK